MRFSKKDMWIAAALAFLMPLLTIFIGVRYLTPSEEPFTSVASLLGIGVAAGVWGVVSLFAFLAVYEKFISHNGSGN